MGGRAGTLRLVGGRPRVGSAGDARARVAKANVDSASMPLHDARAVLAADVSRSLEGGRAALLRPEVRRRLIASGVDMGLREFDSNLVIAIVQDAARAGERVDEGRLAVVGAPRRQERVWRAAAILGWTLALALVIATLLASWVRG